MVCWKDAWQCNCKVDIFVRFFVISYCLRFHVLRSSLPRTPTYRQKQTDRETRLNRLRENKQIGSSESKIETSSHRRSVAHPTKEEKKRKKKALPICSAAKAPPWLCILTYSDNCIQELLIIFTDISNFSLEQH